jgi:hypothetical protein
MKRRILFTILTVVVAAGTVWAQDDEEQDRGVARVSVLSGDVSVKRGDSGDWVAAVVNGPLVVGDSVFSATDSRAELQFDWANFARLGENTEVRMAELDYNRYLLQVSRGTLLFSVIRDSEARVEISLPSVSIRPQEKGLYRVDVFEDGTAKVTVRAGRLEIYTPHGSQYLASGRAMIVRGSLDDPEFRVVAADGRDGLDEWARNRDSELREARSYQYVSQSVYGAEDLDPYGDWEYVQPYGYVWSPRVAAGWAPYRQGRWAWMDWYGWSWVSYDPWGWAPYHYGRWFWNSSRWCWWPGDMHSRHYWRPALVGWIGFGHGDWSFGSGFGFGSIGWVPLAPHEPYHPWYGRRYYGGYAGRGRDGDRITIVNNVNVTNIYRNARFDRGITGMNSRDFQDGHFGRMENVRRADVDRASLMRGALPMTPGRENLRFADRDVRSGTIPGERPERNFYSSRPVNRVERVSFDQQRTTIQQWSQRAAGQNPDRAGRGAQGAVVGNAPGADNRPSRQNERPAGIVNAERGNAASTGGWRSVGEAPRGAAEAGRAGGQAESSTGRGATDSTDRGGWRGVGDPASGRSTDNSARPADSGWGRFGDPRSGTRPASDRFATRDAAPTEDSNQQAAPDNTRNGSERGAGWGRFGDPSRGSQSNDVRTAEPSKSQPAARSAEPSSRQSAPERNRDSGNTERPAPAPAQVDRGSQRNDVRTPEPAARPSGSERNRDSGNTERSAPAPAPIDRGAQRSAPPSDTGRAAPQQRESAPPPASGGPRNRDRSNMAQSEGWSRFADRPSANTYGSSNPAGDASARTAASGYSSYTGDRSHADSYRGQAPSGRSYGYSGGESRQSYSAPSAPSRSFEGYGSRGGFSGGAARSAPSYSAPTYSAPSGGRGSFGGGSIGSRSGGGGSRSSSGGGGGGSRSGGDGGRSGGGGGRR